MVLLQQMGATMRYVTLFAAVSTLALASPAVAADHRGYVGIDAGLLMPDDTDFEYDGENVFEAEHNNGYDLDLVGGYDFGFVRAEGELSWKRSGNDEIFDDEGPFDEGDGEVDVRSIMLNVLGDVGNDQWAFYAGGGIGFARVRHTLDFGGDGPFDEDGEFKLKDSGFAWQGIIGARYAVNEIIDIGLKYRYFDTGEMDDDDVEWDFSSHSIMLSFIYNMGSPPAPPPPPPPPLPPPPPPPPATQTCPDGSVILATDMCPPPPPPPPPPPEPERG
jgi:opacity protein-like surface antigen